MQDIKDQHIKDLKELLRDFIAAKTSQLDFTPRIGKVIDNEDPGKLGRCKIMVKGVFDGLPDGDLPWAVPDQNFVGSLQGSFCVPPVNALVNIVFRDGDMNFPHYTTKILDKNSLPEERLSDYPNSIVIFKTDKGDYFLINTKTDEMIIRSAGGSSITMNGEGDIDIDTMNSTVGEIKITSRTKITVDAPLVEFPLGSVIPTANGPFQALKFDIVTGVPCAGSLEVRQG